MRRVLMVSPHFPPDTSAGAHRVRLLAPHLPMHGWDPTVVTVEESGYEGRLDPELASLVPASVRIVRAPAWPAGLTRRLGIGDLGLRALSGLRGTCRRLLSEERFDALFITIYPTYPALLGPGLKRRYRVPFVLDYQDPWVGSWGRDVGGAADGSADAKSRISRVLASRLEPAVVRAADALTAVSARTYEDVLARVAGARPRACAAIPLGFETRDLEVLRERPRPNRHFDVRDGLMHVCYVGTILPTGAGVLRAVLAALADRRRRAPEVFGRVRMHFLGTSNQRGADQPYRVLPVASELGVADLVTEEPIRLDYLDALNVQAQADALLLLGSSEPHYTPSKVFPAMITGRPAIAVYHAASSVIPLLAGYGAARVITFQNGSDSPALADQIGDALAAVAAGAVRPALPLSEQGALSGWSAAALAGRLAGLFDAIA
jgi:glycosyltransferase involved in cell wall biosynthesis